MRVDAKLDSDATLERGVINYVVMRPLTTTLAFITEVGRVPS